MKDKPINLMSEKLNSGDTEYTPDAILRALMTDVDDFEEIVVIAVKKNGNLHFANTQVNKIHLMIGGLYDVISSLLRHPR